MAVKAVIFDCFGVLVVSGSDALKHDYPQFANELHDLALQADYGHLSTEELDAATAELTGITTQDINERYRANDARLESVFAWVRELRSNGQYKLGLLSNMRRGGLDGFLPISERQELFDQVILSGEVGVTKPAVEIFELTAKRLGVEPYECIMIDDLPKNIEGARRVGMHTILFGNITQAQTDFAAILEASRA